MKQMEYTGSKQVPLSKKKKKKFQQSFMSYIAHISWVKKDRIK